MLLHALTADTHKPCIGLYTSPELRAWKPQPPLVTYDTSVSLDCPHAAPVGGRWFIVVADTSYTTAPGPDGPYPGGMTPYDSGNLFVPKSLFDGRRRIIWGWICDLQEGRDSGKSRWGGTLSMAREIFQDEQGRLCSRPPGEVTAAFAKSVIDLASRPAPLENSGG
jgi:beta-fructofuranosidase